MNSLYLIGGGGEPQGNSFTFGPFVQAATVDGHRKILLVLAKKKEEDNYSELEQIYIEIFESAGLVSGEIVTIFITRNQPLTEEILLQHQPTGIFIGGGLTPLYQEILCAETGWLQYILSTGIPYGGYSAGAAIAAEKALVGGWRIRVGEQEIPVLDEEFNEEIDFLEIRSGLDLVPFSIDVHASQWGTITRLIHAVERGMIDSGFALDEDTMLHVEGNEVRVKGLGQAYYVTGINDGKVQVEIFRNGSVFQFN